MSTPPPALNPRSAGLLATGLLVAAGLACCLWRTAEAPPTPRGPVVRPSASAAPPRRATPGVTTLRLVDEQGQAVAGVPVWAGDGAITFLYPDTHTNAGELLGESDVDGLFVPDKFPVELNVAPWPSAPASVVVEDDGRDHVLTVAPACTLELSWDPPSDPTVTALAVALVFTAPVSDGRATLTLPCGPAPVSTRGLSTPRLEPVPGEIDSRDGAAHLSWREPESVVICVTDEAGAPLPEGEVGSAWRDGDCWRYPGSGCASVSADGFLDTELCPDAGALGWLWTRHEVALERGTDVVVGCDDGPCPARMGVLTCLTGATPDRGRCTNERCTCPDEPDAVVIAAAGPYAGERAHVIDGVATFAHTGTATLTVRGPADGALISRVDRDSDVIMGRIPADGVRRGLVAGTYRLSVAVDDGLVEQTVFGLLDGEHREVTFSLPDRAVDVAWQDPDGAAVPTPETAAYVVEAPNVRALWWRPPARVVPGATLWACVDAGCCRFANPGPRVTCLPDPRIEAPLPW